MSEAELRYIAGVLLCGLVAVAYSTTRKRGLRAIATDTVFCFAGMLAVVAAVAALVQLLCSLK